MLQQHRFLTQWRLGLWVKHLAPYTNNGPLVNLQSHPQMYHQGLDRLSNFKTYNASKKLLDENYLLTPKSVVRYNSGGRENLISRFVKNFKDEMARSKEMKENLKKFREEAKKFEESDALKKARAKYETLENEASALKSKLGKVKGTVSGVIEEASKTEILKKAGKISGEISKTARDAAESIAEKGQHIGSTEAFKTISSATTAVREEIEQSTYNNRVYIAPAKLRKRMETQEGEPRVFDPDDSTVDMVLHKDSRFYESWRNFKDNNAYFNKLLDLKMKYEESDNIWFRMTRHITGKVSSGFSLVFSNSDISSTLTEIVKIDPGFTRDKFLRQCETDIIPNILEAMIRGELDILKDWCHEGPYNVLSKPILQIKAMGGLFDSKILDIENVNVATGKIMDPGPVLIITFTAQKILCVRDKENNVLDGDPNKVLRIFYVWALSRDRDILDPKGAWRLLDITANSVQQLI